MASTYDPRLKIELQGTGENTDTWGEKLNAALSELSFATDGYAVVILDGEATYTLSFANGGSANGANAPVIYITGSANPSGTAINYGAGKDTLKPRVVICDATDGAVSLQGVTIPADGNAYWAGVSFSGPYVTPVVTGGPSIVTVDLTGVATYGSLPLTQGAIHILTGTPDMTGAEADGSWGALVGDNDDGIYYVINQTTEVIALIGSDGFIFIDGDEYTKTYAFVLSSGVVNHINSDNPFEEPVPSDAMTGMFNRLMNPRFEVDVTNVPSWYFETGASVVTTDRWVSHCIGDGGVDVSVTSPTTFSELRDVGGGRWLNANNWVATAPHVVIDQYIENIMSIPPGATMTFVALVRNNSTTTDFDYTPKLAPYYGNTGGLGSDITFDTVTIPAQSDIFYFGTATNPLDNSDTTAIDTGHGWKFVLLDATSEFNLSFANVALIPGDWKSLYTNDPVRFTKPDWPTRPYVEELGLCARFRQAFTGIYQGNVTSGSNYSFARQMPSRPPTGVTANLLVENVVNTSFPTATTGNVSVFGDQLLVTMTANATGYGTFQTYVIATFEPFL